jgi:hypothetical protein
MTKNQPQGDVSIGRFNTLATYSYARALLDGLDDNEAKQRGMMAAVMAVMAASAQLGIGKEHHKELQAQKEVPDLETMTKIIADSFDEHVVHRMGPFFEAVFLPTLKKLVEAGMSYDDLKQVLKLPDTWSAKIRGEEFEERVKHYF